MFKKNKIKIEDMKIDITIKNNKFHNLSKKNENIIFSLMKNKYKKEILDLKNSIEILEYNKMITNKRYNDELQTHKLKINSINKCQICFDNNLEVVSIPCGHMFCRNCINNSPTCHFCRKKIDNLQHIFFS